jgi:hypothetical protein
MHDDSENVERAAEGNRPPLIHLALEDPGRFVVTPLAADHERFASFQLPRLPLSLHCWLAGLGAEFLRRHQRCLAALLVLDCHERRWLRPIIPAQACAADGACWTLDLGDEGPLSPGRRIGGSFQVRLAGGVMDAATSVPPYDGLHMVQTAEPARDGESAIQYFLHRAGQTSVVHAEDVTADDWDQALREASSRMTFD